ncbi:hypothetical protein EDEG_02159 [Edhazardia aedis USNM 41457]|uniref:Uncharacterized protein n=1 Tax=Edhazardia aedis (strain USNM 41457) TaxID=1003232 RepID=J8ZV00_EDHAE|nr:hypothetical protein EDEG_02159 [Edhazardia aedis USNM 41457]|eukprot:EJW03503.1 hypothetical protein EDEG_02159 [Edhazardia aedis USNM 41457]
MEKLAKSISKCMTLNGTCQEHTTESVPPICFASFASVHNLDNYLANNLADMQHHIEENPEDPVKEFKEKFDSENFDAKYGNPKPLEITQPIKSDKEIEKIKFEDEQKKVKDRQTIFKRAVEGAHVSINNEKLKKNNEKSENTKENPEVIHLEKKSSENSESPLAKEEVDKLVKKIIDVMDKGYKSPTDDKAPASPSNPDAPSKDDKPAKDIPPADADAITQDKQEEDNLKAATEVKKEDNLKDDKKNSPASSLLDQMMLKLAANTNSALLDLKSKATSKLDSVKEKLKNPVKAFSPH